MFPGTESWSHPWHLHLLLCMSELALSWFCASLVHLPLRKDSGAEVSRWAAWPSRTLVGSSSPCRRLFLLRGGKSICFHSLVIWRCHLPGVSEMHLLTCWPRGQPESWLQHRRDGEGQIRGK